MWFFAHQPRQSSRDFPGWRNNAGRLAARTLLTTLCIRLVSAKHAVVSTPRCVAQVWFFAYQPRQSSRDFPGWRINAGRLAARTVLTTPCAKVVRAKRAAESTPRCVAQVWFFAYQRRQSSKDFPGWRNNAGTLAARTLLTTPCAKIVSAKRAAESTPRCVAQVWSFAYQPRQSTRDFPGWRNNAGILAARTVLTTPCAKLVRAKRAAVSTPRCVAQVWFFAYQPRQSSKNFPGWRNHAGTLAARTLLF